MSQKDRSRVDIPISGTGTKKGPERQKICLPGPFRARCVRPSVAIWEAISSASRHLYCWRKAAGRQFREQSWQDAYGSPYDSRGGERDSRLSAPRVFFLRFPESSSNRQEDFAAFTGFECFRQQGVSTSHSVLRRYFELFHSPKGEGEMPLSPQCHMVAKCPQSCRVT